MLHALAIGLSRRGDPVAAVGVLDEAVIVDPYREPLVRLQMRCLAAAGRTDAALDAFQRLTARLREDLNAPPAVATRSLAEQIRLNRDSLDDDVEAAAQIPSAPALVSADIPTPGLSAAPLENISAHKRARFPLPLQLTRFVGRQGELGRLTEWLCGSQTRLITLTGPGGSGKTRLAIEAAAHTSDSFDENVWFVDLARINQPRLFSFALAQALQVPVSGTLDPLEQSIQCPNEGATLLVLDNFEHLLRDEPDSAKGEFSLSSGSVGLVRMLLERAPALTCLVTSRQPLRIGGEQEFPVSVLPVPMKDTDPDALLRCASVALYIDRARAVRPDFALTANNCASVAALCQRLEGMPLAIEMAAAWAKTLTPARMLERIGTHMELLTSRRRDLPARHQSMRAAVEWSYDLLDPPLRELFAVLSVFRNGWTAEDAESIAELPDTMVGLVLLQERSLIVAEEQEDETRFRFLELLRQFAAEKLEEAGMADGARERHFRHFLGVAEAARDHLYGPDSSRCFARLDAEQENFRQALEQAPSPGDRLRLACALRRYWYERGHYMEGRRWLEQTLPWCDSEPEALRADAWTGVGTIASNQGDYALAKSAFEQGIALYRLTNDRAGLVSATNNLGALCYRQGDLASARSIWEETLIQRRRLDDFRGLCATLNNLGAVACDLGDLAAAERYHAENLTIKRRIADRLGIAASLNNLGHVALQQGQYDRAREFLEQSLRETQDMGARSASATTLHELGAVHFESGNMEEAKARYVESLALFVELGERRGIAYSEGQLAEVALMQGDDREAERRALVCAEICAEMNDRIGLSVSSGRLAEIAANKGQHVLAMEHLGRALNSLAELDDPRRLVCLLETAARIASAVGNASDAIRLFAYTAARRKFLNYPLPPVYQLRVASTIKHCRTLCGDRNSTEAWAAGEQLSADEAAVLAVQLTESSPASAP